MLDTFDSPRFRTALAVDAVATAIAGMLVYARPGVLGALTFGVSWLAPFRDDRTASRIGIAVAVFGTGKGLLYAFVLSRYGSTGDHGRSDDRRE